jgi:hypothetical protein
MKALLETVFSVWSVPRIYTEDRGGKLSNRESVSSRQGRYHGRKIISIVRSRYQANTSEDTASWKRLAVCSSDLKIVENGERVIVICSYDM